MIQNVYLTVVWYTPVFVLIDLFSLAFYYILSLLVQNVEMCMVPQLWKIIEEYINLRESFGIKDDLFLNSIFRRPNGYTTKRQTANNSQNNQ